MKLRHIEPKKTKYQVHVHLFENELAVLDYLCEVNNSNRGSVIGAMLLDIADELKVEPRFRKQTASQGASKPRR